MRVLMTSDTVGGVWQYSLELSRALDRHGVLVHLAAMGGAPSAAQRAEARGVGNLTLHVGEYRLEWMQSAAEDVAAAGEWLLALERDTSPDLVHVNGFVHAALPFSAPVLLVAHSCVYSWWRAVHGECAGEEWSGYRAGVLAGLQAAGRVVTPTRALLDSMVHEYGPIARSRVIPNGRAASDYAGDTKQPFILTAGRLWDPSKNVALVRDAAEHVAWPVLAAGPTEGPDGEHFDTGSLRALGELNARDLASWLGRAAVFVSTSLYEPFGLSVLEAAHAGCVLVLSDIPSFRETWEDAAVFIPPRDAPALREALDMVMSSAALRESLGERARIRAALYTPEQMATNYAAVYSHLVRTAAVGTSICAS